MCLDLGHAHIAAELAGCPLPELVEPVLGEVILFHVHDNFGARPRAPRAGRDRAAQARSPPLARSGHRPLAHRCAGLLDAGHAAPLQLEVHPARRPEPGTLAILAREVLGLGDAGASTLTAVAPTRPTLSVGAFSLARFGQRANDRARDDPYVCTHARTAASDRGVRRRRILDGVGQHPARRPRARADGRRAPARLLPARPPAATPTTTSSASTAPSRPRAASRRTSRCSGARPASGTRARICSAQDLVYVGGGSVVSLLGTWRAHGDRPRAARGVAGRRRPVRRLGGLAVLVSERAQRLPRGPCAAGRGARLPAVEQRRALRWTSPAVAPRFVDAVAAGMAPGYGAVGRRRAAGSSGPSWPRSSARARGAQAFYVSRRRRGRSARAGAVRCGTLGVRARCRRVSRRSIAA